MINYIYVILDESSHAIKIGFSNDPVKRLSSLQTAHSKSTLRILTTFEGDREQECGIHEDLKEYKLQGEWFDYNSDVVAYLLNIHYNIYNNIPISRSNNLKIFIREACEEYLTEHKTKKRTKIPMKFLKDSCSELPEVTSNTIRLIMSELGYYETKNNVRSVFFTKVNNNEN